MSFQAGQYVRLRDTGAIILVLEEVPESGWRCDDGWVHRAGELEPVADELTQDARRANARRVNLVNEFLDWESRQL
jgi:hypothetical protein